MKLRIARIYGSVAEPGEYRILVDRLWPRGVSKSKAAIDLWAKDVGPSNELRQWFDHDPDKFDEFSKRYRQELSHNPTLDELRQALDQHPSVVLLYSAKDEQHNQAVVLKDLLTTKPS